MCGPAGIIMRKIAASSAKMLLLAIPLFVLGPQFGALDIDGDGVPDVSIIVVDQRNDQDAQRQQSDKQTKVNLATTSYLFRLTCDCLLFIRAKVAIDPPVRLSVVPLRC